MQKYPPLAAISGYDLLKATHIMIDTQSAEVWSKHPDVVRQASFAHSIFITVPSQSTSSGDLLVQLRLYLPLVSRLTRGPLRLPLVYRNTV